MGILGKRRVIDYFSIPIVICGLFLTFLVDSVLYQEDARMGREVFTSTAFHRMNNLYEYVYRYTTAAQIIDSSIRESGGRTDGVRGVGRMMEINRSFRLVELIPEEGETLFYKNDRWLGTGRSLLAGPLKKASEDAKASGKMVLVDSLELDHGRTYMAVLQPVFLAEGKSSNFWGYVLILGNQDYVLNAVGITGDDRIKENYRLTRNEGGTERVLAENGRVSVEDPSASLLLGGDRWTLTMRPYRGWFNRQTIFFATLCGVMGTLFISFVWQKNRTLKAIGGTDSLTKVYNRKGGDEAVSRYLKEHSEGQAMVMALDIDNFKLINDVYGHGAGDEALKTLTVDMRRIFGRETIITRNGGDEFILFHPFKNREDIEKKMTHFTERPHIIHVDGRDVPFHSSMGCAEYPLQGREYGKLCVRADFALYAVKLNGNWQQDGG